MLESEWSTAFGVFNIFCCSHLTKGAYLNPREWHFFAPLSLPCVLADPVSMLKGSWGSPASLDHTLRTADVNKWNTSAKYESLSENQVGRVGKSQHTRGVTTRMTKDSACRRFARAFQFPCPFRERKPETSSDSAPCGFGHKGNPKLQSADSCLGKRLWPLYQKTDTWMYFKYFK